LSGKLHLEALIYCVVWAALAFYGFDRLGWKGGAALSIGLFAIVMPASMVILSRTGSFALERAVRWGILIVAAVILFSVADLS
jgi:hypothetical protein